MKLKYTLKVMEIAEDMIAVPVGDDSLVFKGAIQVNEVTADILTMLQQDVTEESIIQQLLHEYDATYEQVQESVSLVIDRLRSEALLEE